MDKVSAFPDWWYRKLRNMIATHQWLRKKLETQRPKKKSTEPQMLRPIRIYPAMSMAITPLQLYVSS